MRNAATPEGMDGVTAITGASPLTSAPNRNYPRPCGATPYDENETCPRCGATTGHVIGCIDSVPPRETFLSFDERRDYYTDGAHSFDCGPEDSCR